MTRTASTDPPCDKRVVVSLMYICGTSHSTSERILAKIGISEDICIKDLTGNQVNAIRNEIDGVKVEGDLRREIQLNIKRLMGIRCYRGICYRRGLPVCGQRTKINARTRKSSVHTVANKKK